MNSLQLTSSEEFVASRISKSPTGRIRLRESIPECEHRSERWSKVPV